MTKKRAPAKKRSSKKRSAKKGREAAPYVEPKTAAELGITCLSATVAGGICGAPVIWFDYELGEKDHLQGFVCDDHRVSDRAEKLA